MKKYKQLKQQLNESENMDGGALGGFPVVNSTRSAHSDDGIYRVEKEEQLQRLQAFLNAFSGKEYLDPRAALSLLRVKLNLASLDFDFNNKTDIKAGHTTVFKIKRFGGTFGVTPEMDLTKEPFETTDGLVNPINLVVNIDEAPSGLYKLNLKFTPGTSLEQGDLKQTDSE